MFIVGNPGACSCGNEYPGIWVDAVLVGNLSATPVQPGAERGRGCLRRSQAPIERQC